MCYYCPNCLFEVPTASVKAEKNRYASVAGLFTNKRDRQVSPKIDVPATVSNALSVKIL